MLKITCLGHFVVPYFIIFVCRWFLLSSVQFRCVLILITENIYLWYLRLQKLRRWRLEIPWIDPQTMDHRIIVRTWRNLWSTVILEWRREQLLSVVENKWIDQVSLMNSLIRENSKRFCSNKIIHILKVPSSPHFLLIKCLDYLICR